MKFSSTILGFVAAFCLATVPACDDKKDDKKTEEKKTETKDGKTKTETKTTEVKTDPNAKTGAPPTLPPAVKESPRRKYYFGLVDCQDRCNANTDAPGRARCKLRCLKLQPGPAPAG